MVTTITGSPFGKALASLLEDARISLSAQTRITELLRIAVEYRRLSAR